MQTQAVTKNLRISAQKLRLAANKIRGQSVAQALEILTFAETKSAKLALKTLESAIANAENNEGADIDDLVVSECYVDEGATMRRMRARAKGRGNSILKRSSHITVKLSDQTGGQ